jgi:hypothetical protein
MRQRSVLFLALIAAVTMVSSAASAGGCGWCGGCGSAYYSAGLVACDAQPFYVVNQGPFYSGPAIMTYPTYTARSGCYSYGSCGGCNRAFSGCYDAVPYTKPVVHYDQHYHHHRYYHRPRYDHYSVRPRYYDDHYERHSVRPHRYRDYDDYRVVRRRAPRVVYIDTPRRHRVDVHYRGPQRPMYRMKRHHRPLPLK